MEHALKNVGVVILAAGKGKRMGGQQENPKVLMPVLGRPLLQHLLENLKESIVATTTPVIVIAPDLYVIRKVAGPAYEYAIQESQLGTGHAVLAAKEKLRRFEHILAVYGDHPLLTKATVDPLLRRHLTAGADLTLATVQVPEFAGRYAAFAHYGRLIRDERGNLLRIVEEKDASEAEREIPEVNPSYFVFKASFLWSALPQLKRENAQREYYLPDLVQLALKQGRQVAVVALPDPTEALGVNTPEEMAQVEEILQERLDQAARLQAAPLPFR